MSRMLKSKTKLHMYYWGGSWWVSRNGLGSFREGVTLDDFPCPSARWACRYANGLARRADEDEALDVDPDRAWWDRAGGGTCSRCGNGGPVRDHGPGRCPLTLWTTWAMSGLPITR